MNVDTIIDEINRNLIKPMMTTIDGRMVLQENENHVIYLIRNPKKSIGLEMIIVDKKSKMEEHVEIHSVRDVLGQDVKYFGIGHNATTPTILLGLFAEYAEKEKHPIRVTLAGSYRGERFQKMKALVKELEAKGIEIYYPKPGELDDSEFGFFEGDETRNPLKAEFDDFARGTIRLCDAAIFCDYDGHLGSMSSNELYGFAGISYVPCYLVEPIMDYDKETIEYMERIGTLKVGLDQFYKDFGITREKKGLDHNDQSDGR